MTDGLPLLKRKKAAATCTLSLTSVSVHRSAVPFPSSDVPEIPTLASTSSNSSAPQPVPRPRQRTHASLLRRKRCAFGAEPEPPSSTSPTPPRKRARKASLSSPPTLYSSPNSIRKPPTKRNSIAAALGFGSGPLTGDLMFLCSVYRSIAWTRLKREFAKAENSLSSMMVVDTDISRELLSGLDQQETVFMDRLRSYLIFHEINPQWLDVTPLLSLSSPSSSWIDDMEIDDSRDSSSSSPLTLSPSPTPLHLPINPQPQIIASLLFRYRHRVKLSSSIIKSRLLAQATHAEPGRSRRTPRSPLANISVS